MIHIVIFSKDRAAQLDALLRSLKQNMQMPFSVAVLYRSSNSEFSATYAIVRDSHPNVRFVLESPSVSFKELTLSTAANESSELGMLLVDDAILRSPIRLDSEPVQGLMLNNPSDVCLSTRLGKNIDRCYMWNDAISPAPKLTDHGFRWNGLGGDWGYLHSLDGNIYRYNEMIELISSVEFSSPNILEYSLNCPEICNAKGLDSRVLCFANSRVVSIPHNRVQQDFTNNRFNGGSAATLNAAFMRGMRIDITPFAEMRNNTTHVNASLLMI